MKTIKTVLVIVTLFGMALFSGCQGIGEVLGRTGRAMRHNQPNNIQQQQQHQQMMYQLRHMEHKASFDRMTRGGLP